ncbi:hypothetical protein [Bhargavaea cecembensis]|uniref:hypothetical protein n=1 Tax=Bhargavaea cecembensis TaxID=394098 RepID=UPI000590F432|nr:hypothetical protein [Bhargavaea cecembensis]
MPKINSKMRVPDPFVMNEDTVNIVVADFLIGRGFECETPLSGRQPGIDVKARKDSLEVFVESKGSQKNGASADEVFDGAQIVNHLARQIHTLMKYATKHGDGHLYVLANPDIERIRNEYAKVKKTVEKLRFVCMWVQEDRTVQVEGPEEMEGLLVSCGLRG